MADYYDQLGVSCDASDEQLRQAYRKMAMRWHPDKNPNDRENATKRFQQLAQAYQTLSDPQSRRAYDARRRGNGDPEAAAGGGFGFGEPVDPHDIFRQVFAQMNGGGVYFVDLGGGRMGMMSGNRPTQRHSYELPLTLEEVFSGGRRQPHGAPAVEVPPGVDDGAHLPSADGKAIFVVREQPHPRFERWGLDLVHHAVLSFRQVWRGCLYELDSIDQRRISVRFRPRRFLDVVRPGLGLHNGSRRGNLVVRPCLVHPRTWRSLGRTLGSLAHNLLTIAVVWFFLKHPELIYLFF